MNIFVGEGRPFEFQDIVLFRFFFETRVLGGVQILKFQFSKALFIQFFNDFFQFPGNLRKPVQTHEGGNFLQRRRLKQSDPDFSRQAQKRSDFVVELSDARCELIFQAFGGSDGGKPFQDIPMDHHQPHIYLLEFHLILFHGLNLNRIDAIAIGQLLVLFGFFVDVPLFGAHIEKTIVEILIRIDGIFL